MAVLIVAASRHGSTTGIAQAIGDRLRGHGFKVTVAPPEEINSVEGFDTVIIGSAIYLGKWLRAARTFVEAQADVLASKHVWLFSSGPVKPVQKEPVHLEEVLWLVGLTGARGHHLFHGRLDRTELNLAERVVTTVLRVPDGDLREWDQIDAWADKIAEAMAPVNGPDA